MADRDVKPEVPWQKRPQLHNLVDWQRIPTKSGRWLLDGLVPAGAIGWISGKPKQTFKTWMAMLLNMSVASGIPYGKLLLPDEPEPVWFIEEEGSEPDTKSRIRKVQLGNFGHDFWQADPYDGRFFWSHRRRTKLDQPQQVKQIIRTIKANGIKMVTFDAITYMHDGDENKTDDMRKIADAAMEIRAATDATIIGIRHQNKSSQREKEDIDLGARGSSVLNDVYDFHFGLRRDPKTDALTMITRYRDHPESAFNVWWQIQTCDIERHKPWEREDCEKGTCGHTCSLFTCTHQAQLVMSERGEDEAEVDIFTRQVKGKVACGEPFTFAYLKQLLNIGGVEASQHRNRWLEMGLIVESPNSKKKGWIVPCA